MLTKKCSTCGETKSLDDFHKNKNKKDGRSSICKVCACAKSRRWNIDNNEKAKATKRAHYAEQVRTRTQEIKEQRRHYYETNRDAITERNMQYVARNRKEVARRKREWIERNRERIVKSRQVAYEKDKAERYQKSIAWREKNRERLRSYQRKYNARKRGASVGEIIDRDVVFERANGKCHYCGNQLSKGWHIDHIIPLSRGGLHIYENVVAACPRCNQSKNNRTPEEWQKWLPPQGDLGACIEKDASCLLAPPYDELAYLYQEIKLSLAMIAKEYHVATTTVWRWMVMYSIPRRKAQERRV